jgi:hypothetical protein
VREFFIVANSFAAPFMSDQSTQHVTAESPVAALEKFAAEYTHPCGLYAAQCYRTADAYHKGKKAMAQWLSNRVRAEKAATKGKGSYSFMGHSPELFEVDGKRHQVKDPKGGYAEMVS